MNFFLLDNQKRQEKLAKPNTNELWLPVNVRSQGFKNDRVTGTTNTATNKINLLDWINARIEAGDINIPTSSNNGIISALPLGSVTINGAPSSTLRINTSKIRFTGNLSLGEGDENNRLYFSEP